MGSVRQVLLNVSAVLLISIGAPAFGQGGGWPGPAGPVRVDGFDVEEVPGLAPGTELVFSLFGTPNALATLQIDGARRDLRLHEVEPGIYEGSYILDEHDRVDPSARVVASLRRGNDAAQAVLEEPLVLGSAAPRPSRPPVAADHPIAMSPPVSAEAPRVGRPVPPADTVRPRAGIPVPPAVASPPRAGFPVPPVAMQRGVPVPPAVAYSPSAGRPAPPVAWAWPPRRCSDCAVVESIREVDSNPGDGVAGAIAGGLIGALVGDQIGRGGPRDVARIVGAVGGLIAGREIERAGSRQVRYEVALRLPDGGLQVRSYDRPPALRVGDVVPAQAVAYARARPPAPPY